MITMQEIKIAKALQVSKHWMTARKIADACDVAPRMQGTRS